MTNIKLSHRLLVITLGAMFLSWAAGCSDHNQHGEHEESNHQESEHKSKTGAIPEIVIEPSEAAAIGIKVEKLNPVGFQEVIKTGGSILPASGNEYTISSPMTGKVRLSGNYTAGSPVSRGSVIFTITSEGYEGGDNSRQAMIDKDAAKAEFERVEKLYNEKLATAQEYLDAKRNYEKSIASADVYRGSSKGMSAASGIDGYIKSIDVTNGEYVTVGQPLATITSDKNLYLQVNLPASRYKELGSITDARFKPANSDNTYRVSELNGSKMSAGRITDGNTGMIPVTFKMDNVNDIVPGTYAEVYLLGTRKADVLAIPKSAVTENQGLYFVYVRKAGDDDCYLQREVKLGGFDGVSYEVLSGLQAGEDIVTEGAIRVKLAGAANSIPGHTHSH